MGFYGFSEPHPIKDSDIVFTDNTTNDVSITKHGFVPKAPNDGTKFLDGAGAWASPPGSGASTADHFVTTATDADLSAATVIPGMEGDPDIQGQARAGTAHEFSTSTDPYTWSPSAPTTHNSNSTFKSHHYLAVADNTERYGWEAWTPAGAFDYRAKVAVAGQQTNTANNESVGIAVHDAGDANRALVVLRKESGGSNRFVIMAFTFASAAYTQRGVSWPVMDEVYIRLTRDGSNNVSFWFSTSGKTWQLVATQAFTLTVSHKGLYFATNTAVSIEAAIDWTGTDV